MDLRDALPQSFGTGVIVDNVNEALAWAVETLDRKGVPAAVGGVRYWEVEGPVSIVYRTPMRRVLFDAARDVNPFAALFESLWMMGGGRGDALNHLFTGAPLRHMHEYFMSTGQRLQGMEEYGTGMQPLYQIQNVIQRLRASPDTRHALMGIWFPNIDHDSPDNDTPDHSTISFNARGGFLHMTVNSHAADAVDKLLGIDPVRFSILHEVVAVASGLEVGYMTQQASAFFVALDNPFWQKYINGQYEKDTGLNPYMLTDYQPWPVVTHAGEANRFLRDCEKFVSLIAEGGTMGAMASVPWDTAFFGDVVGPMAEGYALFQSFYYLDAMQFLSSVASSDWQAACVGWVMRRRDEAQMKKEGL